MKELSKFSESDQTTSDRLHGRLICSKAADVKSNQDGLIQRRRKMLGMLI